MAVAIIGLKLCKICHKEKPQADFWRINDKEGSVCGHCGAWHEQALMHLAHGTVPKGCQRCGLTFEQLKNSVTIHDDTVRTGMYLHACDGVWMMLCKKCSDWYSPRSGLYKGTVFEHLAKLKGYK